ncbi:MAG TPA: hypothetical protein VFB24_15240 [Candidatus Binatia bacterium]|nr:hypothetical protein [Candidatus Binatia bacterium]
MKSVRKFVAVGSLVLLLVLQGCGKKENTGLPRQTQAPTVSVVLPNEIPLTEGEEPERPTPPVAEPPPTPQPANTKPRKPPKNSGTAKKSNPPATAPSSNQSAQNTQTIANARPKNPADTAAIAAAIPNYQVTQQKEETTRMVDATENALKGLTRSLNDNEKAMKTQVQSYLQQSRKATTDGDFERAYLLAKKAQVLAEALLKK